MYFISILSDGSNGNDNEDDTEMIMTTIMLLVHHLFPYHSGCRRQWNRKQKWIRKQRRCLQIPFLVVEVALDDVLKKLQQHVKVRSHNSNHVKANLRQRLFTSAINSVLPEPPPGIFQVQSLPVFNCWSYLLYVVRPALDQLLAELVANPGSEQLRRLLAVRFGQWS